ncbi:hypothetical protein KSS87_013021 [Heliosperma pusillum]|nr:hypothetical protein KSS87_013021 [Heliosperma pusillum]
MDGFSGTKRLDDNSTGDSVFDASRYAFFGNEIVEEVELGGLEDDEDIAAAGLEQDFHFEHEEAEDMGSFSEIDDLASAFSTNKVVNGTRGAELTGDRDSRESSSVVEWTQGAAYPTWYEQPLQNSDDGSEGKRWSSHPYASPVLIPDSKPLHRTSSYPEPQPQYLPHHHQNFSREPIQAPRSSFPSYPPPGRPQMVLPNHQAQRPSSPYLTGGPLIGLHSQTSLSSSMTSLTHGTHFSHENHPSSQWSNRPDVVNNMLPPHGPQQNRLMPSQLMGQHQQYRLHHPGPPPYGHLTGMHNQLHGPQLSLSPPLLNKFDAMMSALDIRDQRPKVSQNRPNLPNSQHGCDLNSSRGHGGWPVYRSKYMTAYEIENILRAQLAATHSNDPYVEDYYHQACLFKRTTGARLKHHFCPTQLRDLPPRARPNDDPHPFLQVEALGRVPFSSIRRPKPLLDVDLPASSNSSSSEQKLTDKPLDQEPMLAARVTIEDCLCLLLDVDDIDRLLQFNQFPDGGTELKQRLQNHLEGLAASLQLVDPLVKGGQTPKDDLVFLRIVSLPKGRKLLGKYLRMLSPGSELLRIVFMAIFRHLRFLFGVCPADPVLVQSTDNLVKDILACISEMDLNGLSSCLAAVVCFSEQPPLRPIGSSNGDGASVMLKAVLDRATELVRGSYTMPNQTFWKASFDEFFTLLLKYCFAKYESIVIESDAAQAIKREMPVELLRASLPHISDHQHKLLMDLAQKSVPFVGSSGHGHNGSLDG